MPLAEHSNRSPAKNPIGVLAFGSLIWDPDLLLPRIVEMRRAVTPFAVEYARSSVKGRGGAPTLILHDRGCKVQACVLVLDTEDEAEARELLRKREGCGGNGVRATDAFAQQHPDLRTVLYADLTCNIEGDALNAEHLADLAIDSCRKLSSDVRAKNGIRYLMMNIACGIVTPLTFDYREAILRRSRVCHLDQAERLHLELARQEDISGIPIQTEGT